MENVQILARAVDGAIASSLAYPLPRFVHRLMDNTHLSAAADDIGEGRGEKDLDTKGEEENMDAFVTSKPRLRETLP